MTKNQQTILYLVSEGLVKSILLFQKGTQTVLLFLIGSSPTHWSKPSYEEILLNLLLRTFGNQVCA